MQALLFLLALIVRATNRPAEYDSDDEYINGPRQQARQPLINRPPVPAPGVPAAGALDQRSSRTDAWSTRMREKVQICYVWLLCYKISEFIIWGLWDIYVLHDYWDTWTNVGHMTLNEGDQITCIHEINDRISCLNINNWEMYAIK